MRRIVTIVAVLGLGAVLLAPSASAQTRSAPAALKSVTIYIVQRVKNEPPTWGFDQMSITIPPGTIVTWKSVPGNTDGHTSTSRDDVWSSSLLNPGDTWLFTFSKAGRYHYYCRLHPWMVGEVDVVAGAPVPPAAPESPLH